MIGLINFLSILLPGAIATILVLHAIPEINRLFDGLPQDPVFAWTGFFAAAYFSGHLIFLAGSWLDPIYDAIRRRRAPDTEDTRDKSSLWDRVADLLFVPRLPWMKKPRPEMVVQAYRVVDDLRKNVLSPNEVSATNSFQWCRALLIQNCGAAHKDIEVHEADQKFFRSLVILSMAAALGATIMQDWLYVGVSLIAAVASFMRYYNRRLKTVTLAYIHVITLYRSGGLTFRPLETELAQ